MKIFSQSYKQILIQFFVFLILFATFVSITSSVSAGVADMIDEAQQKKDLKVDTGKDGLGFEIPTLGDLLTFAIRGFFVIAGIAALFYMLLGAFAWVTSGGDKDAVSAAQQKIQAAVVGVLVIVAVLAIIWTLEQVIFQKKLCFGLSCPVTLPQLIKKS